MKAYYWNDKTLWIENEAGETIKIIKVAGKVEARKLAKENNAKPWNF